MFLIIIYLLISTTIEKISIQLDSTQRKKHRNLDKYLNMPQIATKHGYRAETHKVVTEDGYILSVHRMSNLESNFTGPPVLLQHGIVQSSVDWILNGDNSLGYLLADQGYDVWLGNARGNKYSKGHVRISTTESKFWNFSFHEMGIYDLPAMVHHISNMTNKGGDIVYIGYSMGTTMYLIFSSLLPEAAQNIKIAILMAPVAFMTNMRPIVKSLGQKVYFLQAMLKMLGINEMFANKRVEHSVFNTCVFLLGPRCCMKLSNFLTGFITDNFNWKIKPVLFKQDPAGTSRKTLIHYGQIIKANGIFRMFSYKKIRNMKLYGSIKPPNYNLSNIKSPIYLMYGDKDPLGNPVDVQLLAEKLPNLKIVHKVGLDPFSHIDFLFNIYAETYVYRHVLDFISNY